MNPCNPAVEFCHNCADALVVSATVIPEIAAPLRRRGEVGNWRAPEPARLADTRAMSRRRSGCGFHARQETVRRALNIPPNVCTAVAGGYGGNPPRPSHRIRHALKPSAHIPGHSVRTHRRNAGNDPLCADGIPDHTHGRLRRKHGRFPGRTPSRWPSARKLCSRALRSRGPKRCSGPSSLHPAPASRRWRSARIPQRNRCRLEYSFDIRGVP